MKLRLILALAATLAFAAGPRGSENVTFEGAPALQISNDKLQLTVFTHGTGLGNLVMADDPQKLSPLWNPIRLARENGRGPAQFNGTFGHFPCVDGFGQPSPEDRAAGIPQHGEAHVTDFNIVEDVPGTVTLSAKLPIVQEVFTRSFHVVPGENVIYVDSQLENLLGFDRPVNWGEHATVSAPFAEPGKIKVSLSGTRSQNRDYTQNQAGRGGNAQAGGRGGNAAPAPGRGNAPAVRRLVPGVDFTWPMAPGLDGKPVDLSIIPDNPHFTDHAATLFDPSQRLGWMAVFNTEKHLVYGYVIRREDYPWVQHWGNYASATSVVRGLEFATQPYDVPKRDTVNMGSMFGTPTFRWLPAKSKIESHFLLFYSRTPEGLNSVDSVRLENGKLTIEDQSTKKQVVLTASRGL